MTKRPKRQENHTLWGPSFVPELKAHSQALGPKRALLHPTIRLIIVIFFTFQNCVNLATYNGKLYEDFKMPSN